MLIAGVPVAVTASVGVALSPPDDHDADMLLRHADQAMYNAKALGKNRYHVFDPAEDREFKAQHDRLRRLEAAFEAGEFVLYYQPKVDLRSGEVVGAEALIRWQHPEDGLLLPAAFLYLLVGSDLELALGDWLIDSVLTQMSTWQAGGTHLVVSANITSNHLLRPDFSLRLERMLGRHPDVAASDLQLEILETAALSDMERAATVLHDCRRQGVRFALDDFGTGYSSLAYFRRLPIDVLKIDRSFVRDMLDDPADRDIVESVVRLAQAFERSVIAEGVESMAHGAMLQSLGCHHCQGHGIARPMPAAEMPAWLSSWHLDGAWRNLASPRIPVRAE
jgi:EAL domain-containing protein (putative c-di-GMP-specific phosphodiesterase class I)